MQASAGRVRATSLITLSCPVLVVFCIVVVDTPAASFAHAAFSGRDLAFRALTHLVDPLFPLAAIGLAGSALAGGLGRRISPAGRIVLAASLSVALAFLFRTELKYAFGRLWPETWVDNNPSWIRDGAYGFHPFHGGTGWSAFPSGHMTMIAAPAAVVWAALPRWRLVAMIPVAAVAVGLYGADFHFVGDIVAGIYLGVACGAGSRALVGGLGRKPASVPPA